MDYLKHQKRFFYKNDNVTSAKEYKNKINGFFFEKNTLFNIDDGTSVGKSAT